MKVLDKKIKQQIEELIEGGHKSGEIVKHIFAGKKVEDTPQTRKAIRNKCTNYTRKMKGEGFEVAKVEEIEAEESEEIVCYEMVQDILSTESLNDSQKVVMVKAFFGIE